MKQLSDLLWEAKADAPAPRFDVDDVVAAGRRRKRRRAAAWAAAAAIVLVTAGVALVVPRGPAVTPVVTPTAKAKSFYTFSFRGYAVEGFVVPDPAVFDLDSDTSLIRKAESTRIVGNLVVYKPGVEPRLMEHQKDLKAAPPVSGREAWSTGTLLFWKYADNAWAEVTGGNRLPPASVREIAETFRPGDGLAVRVGFRPGYLPDGYKLTFVRWFNTESTMTFRDTHAAEAELAGQDTSSDLLAAQNGLITVSSGGPAGPAATEQVTCAMFTCRTLLDGDKELMVTAPGLPESETRKITDGITLEDLTDSSGWPTVNEVLPTSSLLSGTR